MEANKVFSVLYKGLTSRMDCNQGVGNAISNGIGRDAKTGRLYRTTMNVDARSVVSRDGIDGRNPESSPTRHWCLVCQAEINIVLPATVSKEWKMSVKQFFRKHFPVAQFTPLGTADFPFCFHCSKQLDKLINIETEVELLADKFKSLKGSLVSKSAEAYLHRLKSNSMFIGIARNNLGRGSVSSLSSMESLYAQSDCKNASSLSSSASDHSMLGSENHILRK